MPFITKFPFWRRANEDEDDRQESGERRISAIERQSKDSIPAVYQAVNVLSQTMAGLPIMVSRIHDGPEQYAEPDPGHPLSELMRNPSDVYDTWQFWEHMHRERYREGTSCAQIVRSRRGRVPVRLVPARQILRGYYDQSGGLRYRLELVTKRGGPYNYAQVDLPARDVLVLSGPGFDGIWSPSPITYAAIGVLELMQYAMVSQDRMLQYRHLLNTVTGHQDLAALGPDQVKQFVARVADAVERARKRGSPLVLPPGYAMGDASGMSAVDLELIGLLKWSVEDIARVFNVPPRYLMHYHAGFRATKFEYQQEDFVRNTVGPEGKRLAAQLDAKLLMPSDLDSNMRFAVNTDEVSMGSFGERALAAKALVADSGMWMVDEGRNLTGKPRLPNNDGQRVLQPKGAPAQNEPDPEQENRIVERVLEMVENRLES